MSVRAAVLGMCIKILERFVLLPLVTVSSTKEVMGSSVVKFFVLLPLIKMLADELYNTSRNRSSVKKIPCT
jgi:hypothetical protein